MFVNLHTSSHFSFYRNYQDKWLSCNKTREGLQSSLEKHNQQQQQQQHHHHHHQQQQQQEHCEEGVRGGETNQETDNGGQQATRGENHQQYKLKQKQKSQKIFQR